MVHGCQFTSRKLDLWAYSNGVVLDFSRPGKPTDNAPGEFIKASRSRGSPRSGVSTPGSLIRNRPAQPNGVTVPSYGIREGEESDQAAGGSALVAMVGVGSIRVDRELDQPEVEHGPV